MKHILSKLINTKEYEKIHLIKFKNKKDFVLFKFLERHYYYNYKSKEIKCCAYNNFNQIECFNINNKCVVIINGYCYETEVEYTYNQILITLNENLALFINTNNRKNDMQNGSLINLKTHEIKSFSVLNKNSFNKLTEIDYYLIDKENDVYIIKNYNLIKMFSYDNKSKDLFFYNEKIQNKKFFGRKNFNVFYDSIKEDKNFIIIEFEKIELNKKYFLYFNKNNKEIKFSEIKKTKEYKLIVFDNKELILEKGNYSSENNIFINGFKETLDIDDEFNEYRMNFKSLSNLWSLTYIYEDEKYCYYVNKDDFVSTSLFDNNNFLYYRIDKEKYVEEKNLNKEKYYFYPPGDIMYYNKGNHKEIIKLKNINYTNFFKYRNNIIFILNDTIICYDDKNDKLLNIKKINNIKNAFGINYNYKIIFNNNFLNDFINSDPNEYSRNLLSYKLNS